KQILVEFNRSQREYGIEQCIHWLVEAQVERRERETAVVYEEKKLTYGELNAQANCIAHALLRLGLGHGCHVPVLMDRSLSVVPTLLGVMKTGAAFVPLDTNWPTSRLRQALDDLRTELVLINSMTPQTSVELGRRCVNVEELITDDCYANPQLKISSADPIYVIYTSGSTSQPKGVVVPHRGITNRFLWMNEFF